MGVLSGRRKNMSKRMLVDGAHPEEIRVVVTSGNRLDEYDIETTFKKQLKGNIYLAKVTRVEPSLQAAFVDFGGNRHGFFFSEIHPDYYQIPMEDRQALIDEQEELERQARAAREHLEDIDGDIGGGRRQRRRFRREDDNEDGANAQDGADDDADQEEGSAVKSEDGDNAEEADPKSDDDTDAGDTENFDTTGNGPVAADPDVEEALKLPKASSPRLTRGMQRYKIQEVIKRRQILLVQVVKEERGNKGAALTYISLAGRPTAYSCPIRHAAAVFLGKSPDRRNAANCATP